MHFEARELSNTLIQDFDAFLDQSKSFPNSVQPLSESSVDIDIHYPPLSFKSESSMSLSVVDLQSWICPLTICTLSYELGYLLTHPDSFSPSNHPVSQRLPLVWTTHYQAVYVWDHLKHLQIITGTLQLN